MWTSSVGFEDPLELIEHILFVLRTRNPMVRPRSLPQCLWR